MSTYRMTDGTIVDTDRAATWWDETTDFNGSNQIGRSSGSQWNHQRLYRSRKGRYYIEYSSAYQGSMPRAEWVSESEAVRFLVLNDHKLDDKLKVLAEEVCE